MRHACVCNAPNSNRIGPFGLVHPSVDAGSYVPSIHACAIAKSVGRVRFVSTVARSRKQLIESTLCGLDLGWTQGSKSILAIQINDHIWRDLGCQVNDPIAIESKCPPQSLIAKPLRALRTQTCTTVSRSGGGGVWAQTQQQQQQSDSKLLSEEAERHLRWIVDACSLPSLDNNREYTVF